MVAVRNKIFIYYNIDSAFKSKSMHVSSNLVCLKLKYLFSSVLQLKNFSPDGKDQGKGKHRSDINRKFLLGTKKGRKGYQVE